MGPLLGRRRNRTFNCRLDSSSDIPQDLRRSVGVDLHKLPPRTRLLGLVGEQFLFSADKEICGPEHDVPSNTGLRLRPRRESRLGGLGSPGCILD